VTCPFAVLLDFLWKTIGFPALIFDA